MLKSPILNAQILTKYFLIFFAGSLVSLLVWKIMSLDFRYIIAISAFIVFLSMSAVFAKKFEDFLVYAMTFNIPFTIFAKWFMLRDSLVPARGVSLGLEDILLFFAYAMWFSQIFITKTKALPKLNKIDVLVLALLLTQLASAAFSIDKELALFEIVYTFKKILLYFFISNVIKRKHLLPVIGLLIFAIFVEGGFAAFERITGSVNFAASKGNVESEDFGTQYKVLGIEEEIRAAGTTNDSHTLGLYYAMLLPLPFVLLAIKKRQKLLKILSAIALVAGLIGLIITFARSGWLAFAIAAFVSSGFIIFSWKNGRMIIIIFSVLLIGSLFYPKGYEYVYRRVFEAPPDLMSARVELMQSAFEIWMNNKLIGAGPGNYVETFKSLNLSQEQKLEGLPVHNSYLYTVAELGIMGFISFFGIIFISMKNCMKAHVSNDEVVKALSLALFAGFIAYLVDGMTDPMYREAPVYVQLWFTVGLASSLVRITVRKHIGSVESDGKAMPVKA